jgi:flagellar assembly factor FliW
MGEPLVIPTDRFGELTVEPGRIIAIPGGIPGFAALERAVLVPVDPDGLFFWIQAVDDPSLAFLAVVPWTFFPDYEPEIPNQDQAELGLTAAADAMVLCLVTVHRDPERLTANLLGPVIVNSGTGQARQVVLERDLPVQADLRVDTD